MNDSPADALRRSRHEPEAFAAFYQAYAQQLLVFISRRVYDADVALDLVAESLAQAYLGRKRFRGASDADAASWLYGIARRQLALYFRRSRVEQRAIRRLGIETVRLQGEERARLAEVAQLHDLRAALRVELARLSEAQRDALHLRVVEELSYREVARRLEITEQAARARVMRGLKALAAGLDHNPAIEETRT